MCVSAPHLVAGRPVRVFGFTVTELTAAAARHVPGVRGTAVAVLTNRVQETVTLTAAAVTVTVAGRTAGGVAAELVTNALWKKK